MGFILGIGGLFAVVLAAFLVFVNRATRPGDTPTERRRRDQIGARRVRGGSIL